MAGSELSKRTMSICRGLPTPNQDNLFAEPSVMERKLAKQKSTITPRPDNKIDIFAKRNTEHDWNNKNSLIHTDPSAANPL